MAEANLKVQLREEKGKQVAKRLRKEGFLPGILYGTGIDPVLLTVDHKNLLMLLHTFGRNRVVDLTIGKKRKKIKTFIYDIQHDPISGDIIHVDLKQISLTEIIHVSIPVRLTGTPIGVKSEGGIVEHISHTLDVSCFPADIPENFSIDISELRIGDSIHVSDIPREKFEFISDQDTVVVHIIAPKIAQVAEEELVEEEGVELAEPEVIGEGE